MRTARIHIDQQMFFHMIGLDYMDAMIASVIVDTKKGNLRVLISGNDERLPDDNEFPLCDLVCKTIQSHFETIKKETNDVHR